MSDMDVHGFLNFQLESLKIILNKGSDNFQNPSGVPIYGNVCQKRDVCICK